MTSTPASPVIWVFSELYYPEDTSTGHFMTGMAQAIASRHATKVLCGQPTYSHRGTRCPVRELVNNVEVHRCWGTTLSKDRQAGRVVNAVSFAISTLFKGLARVRRGDVIFCVTNPPVLPWIASLVGLFHRVPVVMKIDDVYPDIMAVTGIVVEGSRLFRIVDAINKAALRRASAIIVIGRDMGERIRGKLPGAEAKVNVLPNWADTAEVLPEPRECSVLLASLGLAEKFVVQCAGNMGHPQAVEDLVGAAELLKDEGAIAFLFIGSGFKRGYVEREIARLGLHNITLLWPLPRARQTEFLNACDLGCTALIPGMTGVSVPSRVYNIMAAGKPVLAVCEPGSEVALMVEEEGIGWVVGPGLPLELAERVRWLAAHRADVEQAGRHARHVAETRYSRQIATSRYVELLERVLGEA